MFRLLRRGLLQRVSEEGTLNTVIHHEIASSEITSVKYLNRVISTMSYRIESTPGCCTPLGLNTRLTLLRNQTNPSFATLNQGRCPAPTLANFAIRFYFPLTWGRQVSRSFHSRLA